MSFFKTSGLWALLAISSAEAVIPPPENFRAECALLLEEVAVDIPDSKPVLDILRRAPVLHRFFVDEAYTLAVTASDHSRLQAFSDPFMGFRGEPPPVLDGPPHPSDPFFSNRPLLYPNRLAYWRLQNAVAQRVLDGFHAYSHYSRDKKPPDYVPRGLFLVFFPESSSITKRIVQMRREDRWGDLRYLPLVAVISNIRPLPRDESNESEKFFNQADRIVFLRGEDAGRRMSDITESYWSRSSDIIPSLEEESQPVTPEPEESAILIEDGVKAVSIPVVPGKNFEIHLAGCYHGELIRDALDAILKNIFNANPHVEEIRIHLHGDLNILRREESNTFLRDIVFPEGELLSPPALREFFSVFAQEHFLIRGTEEPRLDEGATGGLAYIIRPKQGPAIRIVLVR